MMSGAAQNLNLDQETAQLILFEITRRLAEAPKIVDPAFKRQAEFILCEERWLAIFGTRRMAKTDSMCRKLLHTGFRRSRSPMLYISLTRDQARRIFWEGTLKPMIERLGLEGKIRLNEQRMEARFSNGSILYVLGMDSDERQMNKLLGGKYAAVGVDECGSFRINLEKLYRDKLRPALIDLKGWICFGGTPEDFTGGFFYQLTRDDETPRLGGWRVFEWTGYDNPYVRSQWQDEIEDLMRENPDVQRTPHFQRNYLGKWVRDKSKLCYKPTEKTFIKELPPGDYYYSLGVDIGYNDATAFSVLALKDGERKAYVIYQFKATEMIVHKIAEAIGVLQKRFFFLNYVIDGSNKTAVETLKQYFSIPFESADKAGKSDAIELLNSAMIMGEFFVVSPGKSDLELEWDALIWDEHKLPRKEEHSGCENHMADATLYVWRKLMMMHYENVKPIQAPRKTDEEKVDEWEERKSRAVLRRKKRPFGKPDGDWDEVEDEDEWGDESGGDWPGLPG
jgi:hypothetical protein